MHLFNVEPTHLRLLDAALGGQLATALADAVRAGGGDLELLAIRERPDRMRPSTWALVVRAGEFEHRFEMDEALAGLGVVAHVYLTDLIADLKADLAATVRSHAPIEILDKGVPRPRHPPGEPS